MTFGYGRLSAYLPLVAGLYLSTLLKNKGTTPRYVDTNRIQLCINTRDPSLFRSQCVDCNRQLFSNTVQGCTGISVLQSNITFEQALCLIENCTLQIPIQRYPSVMPNQGDVIPVGPLQYSNGPTGQIGQTLPQTRGDSTAVQTKNGPLHYSANSNQGTAPQQNGNTGQGQGTAPQQNGNTGQGQGTAPQQNGETGHVQSAPTQIQSSQPVCVNCKPAQGASSKPVCVNCKPAPYTGQRLSPAPITYTVRRIQPAQVQRQSNRPVCVNCKPAQYNGQNLSPAPITYNIRRIQPVQVQYQRAQPRVQPYTIRGKRSIEWYNPPFQNSVEKMVLEHYKAQARKINLAVQNVFSKSLNRQPKIVKEILKSNKLEILAYETVNTELIINYTFPFGLR